MSSRAACLVQGVVRDRFGRPVAEAEVPSFELPRAGGRLEPIGRVNSDENGRFELELAPGDYLLYARKDGRASAALSPVSLQPGERLDEVELVLDGSDSVRGLVVDENGDPVEAQVRASLRGGGIVIDNTNSEADGSFVLDELPDEPLVIEATAGGRRALVELNHPEHDLILRLKPWLGALRVEVRDQRAAPVASATVTVLGEDEMSITTSDEEGVAVLHPGERKLRVVAEGEGTRSESRAVTLDGEDQRVVLTLIRTATVRGRVVKPDGRPVRGFIELVRLGSDGGSMTLFDGAYELTGLQNGAYEVRYADERDDAYDPVALAFTISAPEEVQLADLRLSPAARRTVRGRVLDEAGAPVEAALIEVLGPDGLRPVDAATDAEGRFAIELGSRATKLRATSPTGESMVTPIGDGELTLSLRPVGYVEGVLRGEAGAGAQVRCGDGIWHEVSDAGKYNLRCPLGSELEVRAGDEVRRYPLDLDEGEETYAETRW